MHGICSCMLVYREVVETLSSNKKSNFWSFGNPACGDSTGSNRTEKNRVVYLLLFFDGRGDKEQCDLVCVERV